jgi:4-aminobutyrate aminotransferase-like enzyme
LHRMQAAHPSIGDVRGLGLMIGVELVKDKDTKEPAVELRGAVVQRCFETGLLIQGCGMSTVRFMPALNVTPDLIDEGLEIFERVLTELEDTL